MGIDFRTCLGCGKTANRFKLIAGLCPVCARTRIALLSDLQQQYQQAVDTGVPQASTRGAELIADYRQSESRWLEDFAVRFG